MEQVIIVCICGNEYKGNLAERTIEPRCPECWIKLKKECPDKVHLPPKFIEAHKELCEIYHLTE